MFNSKEQIEDTLKNLKKSYPNSEVSVQGNKIVVSQPIRQGSGCSVELSEFLDNLEEKSFMDFKSSVEFHPELGPEKVCQFRYNPDIIIDGVNEYWDSKLGSDYRDVTKFVTELNMRIWKWYYRSEEKNGGPTKSFCFFVGRTFNDLWKKFDRWCCENFTGKQSEFFFNYTD